jgi:predicted dehydrogenase
VNRRDLLGGASAAWLAVGLDGVRGLAEPATADELRVGVIGPGSRGQEVIRHLLHVPGVQIAAVCDIYEPRYAEVNRLVGANVPATKDYRELLERKDLDAIYVATPISLHAEHVLAALKTSRPVYGEKAMGFTPEQCKEIYAEATAPGALFQVGHQYRYAPWVRAAVEEIKKGKIGEPTHVYAYWHRNNNWRRPVPSPDPGGGLEHLINWRLYRETSGGLVTELGSHHIDIANWVFDAIPERATGMTSIVRYHDGRTVGDNVQAVFSYPGGRRLMFSSLSDNAKMGNELWIYGTEGSVAITIEDTIFYYEPKTHPKPPETGRRSRDARHYDGRLLQHEGRDAVSRAGRKAGGDRDGRSDADRVPFLHRLRAREATAACGCTGRLRFRHRLGDCQSCGVRGTGNCGAGAAGLRIAKHSSTLPLPGATGLHQRSLLRERRFVSWLHSGLEVECGQRDERAVHTAHCRLRGQALTESCREAWRTVSSEWAAYEFSRTAPRHRLGSDPAHGGCRRTLR